MLGNIVEREHTTPIAPAAPRPPTASTSGFPTITHRSLRPKRPSAFTAASARQARDTGVGRAVNPHDIPNVAYSCTPVVESVGEDRQSEAGPSRLAGGKDDEYSKIQREIGDQNKRRVEGMTSDERAEEIKDLEERFGSGVLAALRKRAMQRQGKSQEGTEQSQARTSPMSADDSKASPPLAPGPDTDIPGPRAPETERKSVRFDTPSSPVPPPESDLKSTYFPNTPSEPDKVEWMQPPPSSAQSQSSLRFDLSGHLLSSSRQADLPTHLGLHHHGEQPDLAGYTLAEIMWLCRSTVPAQRVGMMGLLSKVVGQNVMIHEEGSGEVEKVKQACEKEKVCEKAVDLAVEVIQSIKSVTLLQTAVELLYTALGGPTWKYSDKDGIQPFSPLADAQGRAVKLDRVPFDSLLPRLSELLTTPDLLAPISITHLLLILRRATTFSREMAETILPLLPPLLHVHVTRRPWPAQPGKEPLLAPLQLMGDLVVSSRLCATELVDARLAGSILRFCVVSTWPEEEDLGIEMCREVVRIYSGLARYGLASGTARSAYDIWATLGGYVSNYLNSGMAERYFTLLEAWITCAIDPHRTTPEHDLTWTQIAGLGWADEAITAIEKITREQHVLEDEDNLKVLGAALRVVVTWAKGLGINGVKEGEAEKIEIQRRIESSGLVEMIRQIIASTQEPFTPSRKLVVESLKLQNLLITGNESLVLLQTDDLGIVWTTAATPVGRMTLYEIIRARFRTTRPPDKADMREAFDLLLSFQPGEEPLALDLLDDLLSVDWSILSPDLASSVNGIQHPDTITLLRPLLQHAILPDLADILAPSTPNHLYLKASGTLRPSALPPLALENGRKPPGLPLTPSDLFHHPIDELLHSADSAAFAHAPPDWDPTETQIVRATLVFLRLALQLGLGMGRSELIFGMMKVYMLEHQTGGMVDTGESEVFRDDIVADCLKDLVKGLTSAGENTGNISLAVPTTSKPPAVSASNNDVSLSTHHSTPPLNLESTARPFLGHEPFYQFYTDLVSLFENTSFGDPTFAQILLPPLSMAYPSDYRKLIWSNPNVLRLLRTSITDVPLESADKTEGLRAFYEPIEQDPEVLAAYGQAVVRGWVGEQHEFLWSVAVYHLRGFFRQKEGEKGDEKGVALNRLRQGLREAVMSCGKASVVTAMDEEVVEPWTM